MPLFEIKPNDIEFVKKFIKNEEMIEESCQKINHRYVPLYITFLPRSTRTTYLHALTNKRSIFVEENQYRLIFELQTDHRKEQIDEYTKSYQSKK